MSPISVVILVFSILGAVDFIIGNKIGIGKEFERAFSLFCPMALSMLGMIVVAPAIGVWLTPVFEGFYSLFGIDPSIIPASLFANDMGGMTLSKIVCKFENIGNFNAFVTSSMMGCVLSFTVPFALGVVKREQHSDFFFGTLAGIVTVPIGCLFAGIFCDIAFTELLLTLLPLIILSAIIAAALILVPRATVGCFRVFGILMRVLAIFGLVASIFTFLTKIEISEHFDSFENAAKICANACVTLSGALPLMSLATRLLNKPLTKLGSRIGMNGTSTLAFLGTLVSNAPTFGVMEKMDRRGVVLNSAFAVSASFVFGSHLAFTMVFDESFVLPMAVGKITAGIFAVLLAHFIFKGK